MPTRTPVVVLGEDVWPVVRATLGRDAQAMLPAPDDEPESDDEPDDEPKPSDESDDESDDEPDDEPDDESDDEPGTLYFEGDGGWTPLYEGGPGGKAGRGVRGRSRARMT